MGVNIEKSFNNLKAQIKFKFNLLKFLFKFYINYIEILSLGELGLA